MNAKKLLLLVLAILLPFANSIIASNDFSLMQEYGDTNDTESDQTSSLLTETSKELMQAYDLLEMLKKRSDEIAHSDLLIKKDISTQLPRNIDQIRNRLVKKQLLDVLSATPFSNPEKHLNDCKAAILALESYMAELKQQPANTTMSTGLATMLMPKTSIEKEIAHTYDISNEASTVEKASAVVPASLPKPLTTPPLPLTAVEPLPTPSILSAMTPPLPALPPTTAPSVIPQTTPISPATTTNTTTKPMADHFTGSLPTPSAPAPLHHDLPNPTLPIASVTPPTPIIPTPSSTPSIAPIQTPNPNNTTTPVATPLPAPTPTPTLSATQPLAQPMPPALPVPPINAAAKTK
jgi:hypothetical protein